MQIASFLAPGADDRLAATAAAQAGIHTGALSAYYLGDRKPAGLYLGYAGVPDADISGAAQRLAAALTSANTPKLR
jgi:DNA-binding transcriptional MocR family regulator